MSKTLIRTPIDRELGRKFSEYLDIQRDLMENENVYLAVSVAIGGWSKADRERHLHWYEHRINSDQNLLSALEKEIYKRIKGRVK